MEVARVNSNAGVNADLTQTLRAFLTGAAILRTGANVALIQSQQFSKGKYPPNTYKEQVTWQIVPNTKNGLRWLPSR